MDNFHSLIQGFKNFKTQYFVKDKEFFDELLLGQNPHCLVIACCDSRVDPALLLRCKPGDLFVVRNVAALVPSQTQSIGPDAVMSAVEYGVKHLEVSHIIVMGHSHCGGISGLLNPDSIQHEPYINRWVCIAKPALERLNELTGDEPKHVKHRHCEEGAVLTSIDNLLSYDWIMDRVSNGQLELHGIYFDLEERNLYRYSPEEEDFLLLLHDDHNL